MALSCSRPKGRFKNKPMVMAVGLQGLQAGDICPEKRTFRTRRRWWFRRYAVTIDQLTVSEFEKLDKEAKAHLKSSGDKPRPDLIIQETESGAEEDQNPETEETDGTSEQEAGVEDGQDTDGGAIDGQETSDISEQGADEVVVVSATEGAKGWWDVTFSDGTSRKMRRTEVEELGLPEEDENGDPSPDQS